MGVRKRTQYVIAGCIRTCTLNASHYAPEVADEIHRALEDGQSRDEIRALIQKLDGRNISTGAIGRHKSNHLHEVTTPPPKGKRIAPGKRKSDLEILDAFIQRGAMSVDLSTFTVTGEQLLKAIDLKQRLTQGSVFEDFYKAIGAMNEEEIAAEPENLDAQLSEGEQEHAPD